MTNTKRVMVLGVLAFAVLMLASTSWAQTTSANSRTDRQNLWP